MSVSFRLPAGVPSNAALGVAHQATNGALPALLAGTRRNGRFTIHTESFSRFEVVDVGSLLGKGPNKVGDTAQAVYDRLGDWLGYRGEPPSCDVDSESLESSVDDTDKDPVIYARDCEESGGQILKIVNNRAFGWEFPVPDGARVERTSGRGFSETVCSENKR